MTFEAIRDGRLLWDDKLPVSEHAMSYRGSSMFLDTTDRVTVRDLIRGIIVLSGNDACVVVAEALSPDGTETGFANMMTSRAKKLGMTNSIFANSNGWPSPQHRMSMKDLAILANKIVEEFPNDIKLAVDHRSEELILEFLKKESEFSILSEECGSVQGQSDEYTWIVDPLDGSLNYFQKIL